MRMLNGCLIYEGTEKLKQRIERAKANVGVDHVFDHFGFSYRREGNFNCPFHTDDSPSARLYDNGQYFKCFAGTCAFKGDVIGVVQRVLGCPVVSAVQFIEATFRLYDIELPEVSDEISLTKYRAECERAVMDYYSSIRGKLDEAQKFQFEQAFVSAYDDRVTLNAWFCKNGAGNESDFAEVQKWARRMVKGLSAWEAITK